MAKKTKNKRKLSPMEKGINAVLVLVLVLVLVVAGFATGPKIWSGLKGMLPQPPAPDTSMVSGFAESLNMTVDEFKKEYELADTITGETTMMEAASSMTLKSYAKLNNMEYSQMVEEMGISDQVTEDTTWGVAELLIPIGNYTSSEEEFNQLKEFYQLDDSITKETPWGEVLPIIQEKEKEMSATKDAE